MAKDPYKVGRDEWSYQVRGRTRFPLDMLRYDAATPYQSEDTTTIERSLEFDGSPEVTVRLTSRVHGPTVERWLSFGWIVESYR